MIQLYELAGADPEVRFSPYCWRIRMALAHKGLEPETLAWRFKDRAKLPGKAVVTQVPVLLDQGRVLSESTRIAFYLEHEYDSCPSLFGGPAGEPPTRFIIHWADSVLNPGLFPLVVADVFAALHPRDQAYFRESREKRLGRSLEQIAAARGEFLPGFRASLAPLRRTLAEQRFLGGEEPSYADYAVFGGFQWARVVSPADVLAEDDTLVAWRSEMLGLFEGLAAEAKRAV